MDRRSPFVHAGHHIGPAKMSRTSLVPRNYQIEAVSVAIAGNTVINMDTGGGKTLIAVIVMDFFLSINNKAVCFVVPTRALVSQQAQYLRDNCKTRNGKPVEVKELRGKVDSWTQEEWAGILKTNRIIVGLPEVLKRALVQRAYIHPTQFSLIVFDECDSVTGNSASAAIMRDSVLQCSESSRPRILGLTASFVCGSTSCEEDIVKKRADLEMLLQSTIFSPVISTEHKKAKTFYHVLYPDDGIKKYEHTVKDFMREILNSIPETLLDDMEREKSVNKGWNLFSSVGSVGLRHRLREDLIPQILAKATNYEIDGNSDVANGIMARIAAVEPRVNKMELYPGLELPKYTAKLKALFKLLIKIKDSADNNEVITRFEGVNELFAPQSTGIAMDQIIPFKFIIFVKEVASTYPLTYLINNFFEHKYDLEGRTICLPVSGVGSMSDATSTRNLDMFRSGAVPLLVTTSALELGIDVPDCPYVIRFDGFDTTKSHIQGSGRARHKDAKIFYFDNDPYEESVKAATVDKIAKDKSLDQTPQEMRERLEEFMSKPVNCSFYPYSPIGDSGNNTNGNTAVVNLFNCLTIFSEFCQKSMRQSPSQSDLYIVSDRIISTYPQVLLEYFCEVNYPTPDGIMTMTCQEIDLFWDGVLIKDIVQPELLKPYSGRDIAKRRAVYVVVLELHKLNLLNESNKATLRAELGCQQKCAPYEVVPMIKLK